MRELLENIGINIGISVAGLFGSLLLIGKQSASNTRTTFFSILSGVASANYITPAFIDVTQIDIKYQMSIAFILGFLGLKGVEIFSNKLFKKIDNGTNSNS